MFFLSVALRNKTDPRRKTINILEAEIVNVDKKAIRALRKRSCVLQETAAQNVSATAAASRKGADRLRDQFETAAGRRQRQVHGFVGADARGARRVERQGDALGGRPHRAAAHAQSSQRSCSSCQQGERCGHLRARSAGVAPEGEAHFGPSLRGGALIGAYRLRRRGAFCRSRSTQ
eukprot:6172851-Pleurochrysis_carterae.AAC.3